MKHETYWVTVATLIPVLAIASIIELRTWLGRLNENAAKKDLSPEGWFYFSQAIVMALMVLTLPVVLASLYNNRDPSAFFHWAVTSGVTTTAGLLVAGPTLETYRAMRYSERVKPRPSQGGAGGVSDTPS